MFTILQRLATPTIRASAQLVQGVAYCNNVPRAILKKKSKAKDVYVSLIVLKYP